MIILLNLQGSSDQIPHASVGDAQLLLPVEYIASLLHDD